MKIAEIEITITTAEGNTFSLVNSGGEWSFQDDGVELDTMAGDRVGEYLAELGVIPSESAENWTEVCCRLDEEVSH